MRVIVYSTIYLILVSYPHVYNFSIFTQQIFQSSSGLAWDYYDGHQDQVSKTKYEPKLIWIIF